MSNFYNTRQCIIEELHKLKVYQIDGRDIETLDFDRLQEEFILALFKQIDITSDSNRWF